MSGAALDSEAVQALVMAAQEGSRPAADQLVRAHEGWVRSAIYAVTGRIDLVDDIAQQVWTQVWERLDTLNDPRRLRPWLYRIARNAAIDAGQARKRRSMLDIDETVEPAAPGGTSDGNASRPSSELHDTLLRSVQALPAHYREPFVLRHLEDWSYAEIGELLNLPVETVETRLVRARRLLREMLADKVEP